MEDSGHFHQNGVLVCADSAGSGNLQFTFLVRMLIDYLFSPHLNYLSNACYRGFLKIGLMRMSFFSRNLGKWLSFDALEDFLFRILVNVFDNMVNFSAENGYGQKKYLCLV